MALVALATGPAATVRYCLFAERVKCPSDVAVPDTVRMLLLPEAAVGIAICCTRGLLGVVLYSFRKIGVALALRALAFESGPNWA